MELYTARMQHSRETVRHFVRVQYDSFEWGRKLLMFVLSVAVILAGLASGTSLVAILCLFVGCILLTNSNARADSVADGVIEAMHGSFPALSYRFTAEGFTDGEDRPVVPYDRLYRLIDDGEYLCLFTSKASGYMLRRDSVAGEGGADGLMRLLSEKSGLPWQKPFKLLSFRLRDILPMKR